MSSRRPLDILVTCHPHAAEIEYFPQVRGHYLAKHLARAGLRAEFRHLPQPGLECEALVCSEYQCPMEWFERYLAAPLSEIRAERMYCLADYPLGDREHFSTSYCGWFARHGGVLCHLADAELAPYERWVGIGVDTDVVGPGPEVRDGVLFDFPRSQSEDVAATFDAAVLEAVRARLPGCRIVGTGWADAPVRGRFEEWVAYGQPHSLYVSQVFRGIFAVVAGWDESMGLALAEAQVTGACIVAAEGQVKAPMLCPSAAVSYERDDPASLTEALAEARARDAEAIASEAAERFDYLRVVERVRAAIGV